MKNDLLAYRHIGISEKRRGEDAPKIGVKSLDELIDKTIPANIRLKEPLALPKTMTEYEFGQHIAGLAAKTNFTQPISVWDGTIPSLLPLSNGMYSRTPFGTLPIPLSDRSLTRTPGSSDELPDCRMRPHRHALANCSLLDEATAAAEAVTMMYALRPRDMQKSGANVVFVDEAVFPQTLAVMTTRAIPQGIELRIGKYHEMEFTPDIFACVLQYPNAAGNVEDYRAFVEKAHAANCKVAVAADILSLALLTLRENGELTSSSEPHNGSVHRCSTAGRRQPTLPPATSTSAICRDASSAGRKTNTASCATAWRCKPASSTSSVKRRLPTSVPRRHCWLQWQAFMPYIMVRKVSAPLRNASTALPYSWKRASTDWGYKRVNAQYFDTLRFALPDTISAQQIRTIALSKEVNLRYFKNGDVGMSIDETTDIAAVNVLLSIFAIAAGRDWEKTSDVPMAK